MTNLQLLSFTRFSIKDKTHFAKSLSFLIKAGVPIVNSLHIIRDQTRSRSKARVFDRVIADVTNGQSLHLSLARFRHLFGDLSINLIRIGELSGILNQNLNYLADELKKKHILRRKVMGAMVYPIFITIATLGIASLLTVFIFPKILPIFRSLKTQLPLATRILIWLSDFLRHWGIVVVLTTLAVIVTLIVLHKKTKFVHRIIDQLILRTPLVGPLATSYNLANFTRTLGLLLKSGVRVGESIHITAESTANLIYRRELEKVSQSVQRGEHISKVLAERPRLFPHLMVAMITIGEQTGSLSDTLVYLSEMYEGEVDEMTKNLSNSIEPVLMIVMGIIVGFIAISVITPIYEITQNLHPRS